ncbi:cell division protein SepF [Jeotgalicoccus coquinae]|uniref:Cell division protein SepF n=1 Tax=Jeotgalicoccus coquinae TaxID=709509 RepID=A0A6V7RLD1_9STAP|nr:cell division protein SepF [Jeotgalicoccus coquinae]MBB6422540.1 cell division inhibitor SepF [Jeotgalicoccus coquinae]CAD2078174.1 Cell division protein SepF [Jeotgalicoccus coquinae]
MAITKFIKDLFVVEEEVPVNDKKTEQTKTPAKVTNLNTNKQPNSRQKETAPKKAAQSGRKLPLGKQGTEKPAAPKARVQNKQQEQKKTNQPQNRESRTMPVNDQNTKVCLFEPRVFAETQDIADELKSNRAALVNLTKIDSVPKKRIVDFLSGTVYALEGDIQKVGADIFLCTPNSFGVEGEISDKEEFFDEM